jgi:hypothetical protein
LSTVIMTTTVVNTATALQNISATAVTAITMHRGIAHAADCNEVL